MRGAIGFKRFHTDLAYFWINCHIGLTKFFDTEFNNIFVRKYHVKYKLEKYLIT